ncbi:unnamed protein product [Closterium sp. Naga37s-1]|nr:unnamed protein product [Closterium sp. Naga37s-1]
MQCYYRSQFGLYPPPFREFLPRFRHPRNTSFPPPLPSPDLPSVSPPTSHGAMTKKENSPRLYVRAVVLGHKRGKSNVHEHTSLLQIENVQSKEESQWYLGKRIVYIYKAKTLKNGSLYRSMWGRVTRPHGNTGVVRAKFKKNLPCTATTLPCLPYPLLPLYDPPLPPCVCFLCFTGPQGRFISLAKGSMAVAVISARSCKPIALSQSLCRTISAAGAMSTHGSVHGADRGALITAAGTREFHGAAASGEGNSPEAGGESSARPAQMGGREAERSTTEQRSRIVVMGGNGFVGSAICRNAIGRGIEVASVNRSGQPSRSEAWIKEVEWIKGDALNPSSWKQHLQGATGVVSCVGAFGSNEWMRRINGDANVGVVNAAREEGVARFVFISAHDVGLPAFVLRGYYEGKKAAEAAVMASYPNTGVVLRPAMIHGTRRVGAYQLPLSLIGAPLEIAFQEPVLPLSPAPDRPSSSASCSCLGCCLCGSQSSNRALHAPGQHAWKQQLADFHAFAASALAAVAAADAAVPERLLAAPRHVPASPPDLRQPSAAAHALPA